MKIKAIFSCLLTLCLSISIASCDDSIEKDLLSEGMNGEHLGSRSMADSDYYYWYQGEKVGITSVPDVYYISSPDSANVETFLSSTNNIPVKNTIKAGKIDGSEVRYWSIIEIPSNSIISTASELIAEVADDNIFIAPVFGDDKNDCIATTEFFYVKIKEQGMQELIDFAKEQGAEVISEVDYVPNWFILKASKGSNGLLMSNIFYESGKFDDVDPAFMFNFEPKYRPTEPNIGQQWGLDKINVYNAWDLTKGKSEVIIAVLDQGVDKSHKEFANNYSSLSYDLINKSTPSVVRGDHGTHVGGIIGANHNNIQIAGVAPNNTIMSISHPLTISPTISSELASGIGYAQTHGAAVINNSWGDQGGKFNQLHSSILENAITSAIKNGRSGKGMVVVFASGNYNKPEADYPANFSPDILVVGSVDNANKRSSFASYGSCVDVVAPGTDILSTLPGNNVGLMSGTSMAAPHVAAIAGLILSVNPELSGKDVVNIIERSAQKIGSYSYTTTSNRPNGTWNNEMGYGLCNAFAAVSMASSDIVLFNNQIVSQDQTVSGWIIQSKDVSVNNRAKLTFNIGESLTIDVPFTVEAGSQLEIVKN